MQAFCGRDRQYHSAIRGTGRTSLRNHRPALEARSRDACRPRSIRSTSPSPHRQSGQRPVAGWSLARLAFRAKGSLRSSSTVALPASISYWVRLRMKTGRPSHLTVSDIPPTSEDTSTSMEAVARVDASGASDRRMARRRPQHPLYLSWPSRDRENRVGWVLGSHP